MMLRTTECMMFICNLRTKRREELIEMRSLIPSSLIQYTFDALPEFSSEERFRRNNHHLKRYQKAMIFLIGLKVNGKKPIEQEVILVEVVSELLKSKIALISCINAKRLNISTSMSHKLILIKEGLESMIDMLSPSI